MSDHSDKKNIRVIRKGPGAEDISTYIKLKITDKLSEIREQLTYNSTIRMDDTVLFLQGDNFNIVSPNCESERHLKDIISMEDTIYLKNCEIPDPEYLKSALKLEYGLTLIPNDTKIETAKEKAFTIDNIELIKPDEAISDETANSYSMEAWKKKIDMFFNAKSKLMNYGLSELSFMNTQNENQETKRKISCKKISKMHLRLSLKLTEKFIEEIKEAVESDHKAVESDHKAIGSKAREKLRKIIKEFGQFVPTEVTLGGIIYAKEESNKSSEQKNTNGVSGIPAVGLSVGVGLNSDEKQWVNSLYDYRNWKCIEFQEPKKLFELLDEDIRQGVYKVFGKKILYRDVIPLNAQLEYGEYKIVELPLRGKINKIIKKEEADCNVFATIVGDEKNDFYNCQIYHPRNNNEKPKLIIHCYQKIRNYQPRRKLKIGFMIIGYDFDSLNDESAENDDMRFEVVNHQDYENSGNRESTQFTLDKNSFLGIPVLNELNNSDKSILIGHYFIKKDNVIEANVFSYSLDENKYVKLPKFMFQVLVLRSKTYESEIAFKEKLMRLTRPRRYIENTSLALRSKENNEDNENTPKYISVSVYSTKGKDNETKLNCDPVFLKQKNNEIKLKYAVCKCKGTCSLCECKSLKSDLRCAYLVN
ncbi:hypothetical protein RclHR1_01200007 [Rhizophagus clarus]|uniref:Uncharacterized protein n=1 Tax=Rhizophagus clarus TaxID=94130 RepID=A0A2Z6Q5Z3_9GLOM|nr:hypothetical protein RclHR1_01200007 [Rhizophagus clarus]GES90194.1 hypothetical protein GLOIN_2v1727896 [Rhizophagus clarus]